MNEEDERIMKDEGMDPCYLNKEHEWKDESLLPEWRPKYQSSCCLISVCPWGWTVSQEWLLGYERTELQGEPEST